MSAPLRVLIVEDRPADAELLAAELVRFGFEPRWQRAETEAEYLAGLDPTLDAILSDYSLPQFDALRALELLQQRDIDIPFIVVTGALTEEVAVECIKRGAADYLLKDRLARLGPAVTQALEQRRLRENARRAAAALSESEARYRSLFEQSREAIFIIAAEGRFLDANAAGLELLGYTRDELLSLNVEAIYVNPLDRAPLRAAVERTGWARDWEVKLRKNSGAEMDCLVTSMALRSPDGSIAGYQSIVRDVSEQRRVEEQLRTAQKMEAVGRLAGGIAHDFNNLLTVIIGRAQFLQDRLRPEDPFRRDIELIKTTAERAATLTQQLLAFSRRQILQPRALDLNAVVQEMEPMLRRLIEEDIELVIQPAPDLGVVRADRAQIEQILVNLAVNARDAMPEGGQITIETANVELDEFYARRHVAVRPGPYVMLGVTDSGTGMDETIRVRIFEPFFTTKGPGKGTGLGLATVYGIVKQHGGNIWVYSEPGRGTTFKVYLPRTMDKTEPPLEQPVLTSFRGTETILLVEDEDEVRELARDILERLGYMVLEAGDAGEAELLAGRHAGPIHLLLTDVVMPRMSGAALARRLTAIRPEMKVLYMSGYTDNAIVHHGVVDPETPFLQKPFRLDALARKIREVIEGGRGGAPGR